MLMKNEKKEEITPASDQRREKNSQKEREERE